MVLLPLLLACARTSQPAPAVDAPPIAEAPAPADAPAPPPADAPPATDLVGAWSSEACGERAYLRVLRVAADGSWAADDLIAPCPPTAVCVWSGIVHSGGSWTPTETGIALVEATADHQAGRPRPTALALAEDGTAVSDEPDGRCAYHR